MKTVTNSMPTSVQSARASLPRYSYIIAQRLLALMASQGFAQRCYGMKVIELMDELAVQVASAITEYRGDAGIPNPLTKPGSREITDHVAENMLRFVPAPVQRLYAHERAAGKIPKAALIAAAKYLSELRQAEGDNGHD